MSLGEGRVNLYRSEVALNSSLSVLHLFQCISHVGVCISKRWVYPIERYRIHYTGHFSFIILPKYFCFYQKMTFFEPENSNKFARKVPNFETFSDSKIPKNSYPVFG